jgi:ACS family hexuronate transporter-like MFS transporter
MGIHFSWQIIYIIVGLVGLLWLVPWLLIVKSPPEKHPWLTDNERNYILEISATEDTSLAESVETVDEYNPTTPEMLKRKESWGVILASAAIDPIWWLFVFWIPIYLTEVYNMDVKGIAIYGWVPYVGAMIGAWFGGLLAQNRLKSGWTINKTRKFVISLGCFYNVTLLLFVVRSWESF